MCLVIHEIDPFLAQVVTGMFDVTCNPVVAGMKCWVTLKKIETTQKMIEPMGTATIAALLRPRWRALPTGMKAKTKSRYSFDP